MRIRYKRDRIPYHGSTPPRRWLKGDEDEVPEAEGARLVTTFPEWFEAVEAPPAQSASAHAAGDSKAASELAAARGVTDRVTKPARGREK